MAYAGTELSWRMRLRCHVISQHDNEVESTVKISVCNIARKSQQQEYPPVNIKLAERLADSITSIKSTKIIWAKRFGRAVISVAIEIPRGSHEAPNGCFESFENLKQRLCPVILVTNL